MTDDFEPPAIDAEGGDSTERYSEHWSKYSDRKLDYIVEKYDIEEVIPQIRRRWQDDSEERWSIRTCGRFVNERIVESVLGGMTTRPVGYRPDEIVELLTADEDEIDVVRREELRRWLEGGGIDPDELTDDFVNYHTVYDYLREVTGAESPEMTLTEAEQRERARNRGQRTITKSQQFIQREIEQLQHSDLLEGNYDVVLTLKVRCNACGAIVDYTELVENGCNCGADE